MSEPRPKIEIIPPDGAPRRPWRRFCGAFRPYAPGDGRPPGWKSCGYEVAPADRCDDRRARKRGRGDIPAGSILDLES
ncbi:MAG: hypothetical protein H6851_15010 [Geminicoccaceae bacterium]|nr:hypothetical protein [Geminicoccaceae bacterium]